MEDRQSEAEGLASACFRGYYEIAPGREMLERGRLDLGRRGKIELGEAGEQARLEREVGPAAAVALALAAAGFFGVAWALAFFGAAGALGFRGGAL